MSKDKFDGMDPFGAEFLEMETEQAEEDLIVEEGAEETAQLSPTAMPTIALRGVMVFPHTVMHLDVGRAKSVAALDEAMLLNREIFVVMQKDVQDDDPGPDQIYQVGTIAEIKQVLKLPGGTVRMMAAGLCRGVVKNYVQTEPYLMADVEEVIDPAESAEDQMVNALHRNLVEEFQQYARVNKKISADIVGNLVVVEEPGKFADMLASALPIPLPEKQKALDLIDVKERLQYLLETVIREMELAELEKKLHNRVKAQIDKNQREYYLREQIRAAQKELGEDADRAAEIDNIREQMSKRKLPLYVKEKLDKELKRLRAMSPQVAEATIVQNYIDCLMELPWEITTKDSRDLARAERILDEDHYGLEKIKERILEYLAVKHMTKSLRGPILCFVGPPGVGKTSLAASIARALNRKYVRISLGGVRDEAEIRGHRRTYIGAMPGRIIQQLKVAGTSNPLFLLDEIDKMASDFRGDPASAMLEVLDPAQNNTFADHYLEIPYDLSKVMFVTTANVEADIPGPLRDRMEIIRLSGYTDEEKMEIAKRHLVPRQMKEHGLKEEQFNLSENALRAMIRLYTREAGVRDLERNIGKCCRRSVRDIVAKKNEKARITAQNLEYFLGKAKYLPDNADKKDEIGKVNGMAWTAVGGELLEIEAVTLPGKGNLILTGQLGDVMKESARAGWTYLRSKSEEFNIPADINDTTDLHIHVPEGAVPKDGPSAGITMATALASIFTNRPVRHDVAMTGEITLRGRVLAIGGLKEKAMAAYRNGIKTVILPMENKRDIEDIPQAVRKKLTFVPVETLEEVLEVALLPAEKKPARKSSKKTEKKAE